LTSLEAYREAGVTRLEREYLGRLMKRTGSDVKEACRISGLSRSRLYTLLRKYQIRPAG
jgi:DNA-binding NtrC family response regulator